MRNGILSHFCISFARFQDLEGKWTYLHVTVSMASGRIVALPSRCQIDTSLCHCFDGEWCCRYVASSMANGHTVGKVLMEIRVRMEVRVLRLKPQSTSAHKQRRSHQLRSQVCKDVNLTDQDPLSGAQSAVAHKQTRAHALGGDVHSWALSRYHGRTLARKRVQNHRECSLQRRKQVCLGFHIQDQGALPANDKVWGHL